MLAAALAESLVRALTDLYFTPARWSIVRSLRRCVRMRSLPSVLCHRATPFWIHGSILVASGSSIVQPRNDLTTEGGPAYHLCHLAAHPRTAHTRTLQSEPVAERTCRA